MLITKEQQALLQSLGKNSNIAGRFYLTGGTALAGFYLQHRYSEDLDFFSEQEVDIAALNTFWQTIRSDLGITGLEYQHSFNRHLYFLQLAGQTLKIEFTYFPFPRIEPGIVRYGVTIDSLIDIAVNKLFTIYQQPRARDYIDLFCICHAKKTTISDLIVLARNKFEQHLDPLQLGTQFSLAPEAKDYPRLVKKINSPDWQDFFIQAAKNLEADIFTEP